MTEPHGCEMMRHAVVTDDIPIFYRPQFRSWVVEQQDGLGTRWQIKYCPWCGADLGDNLGEQWLRERQRRGIGPDLQDEDLPEDLRDERWWRALAL